MVYTGVIPLSSLKNKPALRAGGECVFMSDDLLILICSKCAALRGAELALTPLKLHIRGNASGLVRPDPPPLHRLTSLVPFHNCRCLLVAVKFARRSEAEPFWSTCDLLINSDASVCLCESEAWTSLTNQHNDGWREAVLVRLALVSSWPPKLLRVSEKWASRCAAYGTPQTLKPHPNLHTFTAH